MWTQGKAKCPSVLTARGNMLCMTTVPLKAVWAEYSEGVRIWNLKKGSVQILCFELEIQNLRKCYYLVPYQKRRLLQMSSAKRNWETQNSSSRHHPGQRPLGLGMCSVLHHPACCLLRSPSTVHLVCLSQGRNLHCTKCTLDLPSPFPLSALCCLSQLASPWFYQASWWPTDRKLKTIRQ